jgi:hypothetical protein
MPQITDSIPRSSDALARRGAIALVGGGGVGALLPSWGHAASPPGRLAFDVHLKGDRIGEHGLEFAPTPHGQRVTSQVDLAVKMAFVTVYRYRQTAQDEWRDGTLVGTRIATDDDGEETLVVAAAQGRRLLVSGPKGDHELALGTMTDLNFWNEAITRQGRLIDSQNGELLEVRVTPDRTERVMVRGTLVEARRFAMSSTKGRSGTVWYDAAGNLVQATVHTRGHRLDYRLAA